MVPTTQAQLSLKAQPGSHGISVPTIGMASDVVSSSGLATFAGVAADLDEETLKSIAEIASGQFFHTTDSTELAAIYNEIDKLEGTET